MKNPEFEHSNKPFGNDPLEVGRGRYKTDEVVGFNEENDEEEERLNANDQQKKSVSLDQIPGDASWETYGEVDDEKLAEENTVSIPEVEDHDHDINPDLKEEEYFWKQYELLDEASKDRISMGIDKLDLMNADDLEKLDFELYLKEYGPHGDLEESFLSLVKGRLLPRGFYPANLNEQYKRIHKMERFKRNVKAQKPRYKDNRGLDPEIINENHPETKMEKMMEEVDFKIDTLQEIEDKKFEDEGDYSKYKKQA